MRTIKELLELLLNNRRFFQDGLCQWVRTVHSKDLITKEEADALFTYIKANRPNKYSNVSAFLYRNSWYYWKVNEITYRIDWINKHIKKLS